ncbi:tRNA (5-methylaminomethyl-2-thiouridylate)-methyltransferase / FAD-dependent cmnm(5)s(2)U34 oxidoreductase [hydrothermal vent metagenome]|uniref:tRNA (5-methylaminomethyl-2-thiouridylate)-methyltransferase / FAD-dependent cmnm(5)s(2)U34 oxidoreductase n=1 Tax=hydrothermal vent metagenome TaxID=652676 RepID=A0A3B0Z2T7_9ZZZZ
MNTQENITWNNNTPSSTQFEDVYYSTTDGLAETQNVFILGNQLPQRWQQQKTFVIGETGFGTGLNFVATLAQWEKSAPQHAQLNYISVEKYPLSKRDIKKALNHWSELDRYVDELLQVYPSDVAGFHRLKLLKDRVSLTLMIGDAKQMYRQLIATVDAWYLDGFAPSRNPGMWSVELCKEIARLSQPGTTFSTYTAAGQVRRNLHHAGFNVSKVAGHGKRERLCGSFNQTPNLISQAPWFHPPNLPASNRKKAIIIGGGIAGISMAHTLSQSEWQTIILEQEDRVAAQASGNKAGIVMPKLTLDMDKYAQFHLSAFFYTVSWLRNLQSRQPSLDWHPDGVLELVDKQRGTQLAKLKLSKQVMQALDAEQASLYAGLTLEKNALFFPTAGWLAPANLCTTLLKDNPEIHVALNQKVSSLQQDADNTWHVSTQTKSYTADVVVICNGPSADQFQQTKHLPITPSRGQISDLKQTASAPTLLRPICYGGYVIPLSKNELLCGASYTSDDKTVALKKEDHDHNIKALRQHLPDLLTEQPQAHEGRAATRATTIDRLPLIGPVANESFYRIAYQDIKHGKRPHTFPLAQYHSGLYIASGFGSRGLTTAAIAAELVTNLINNKPLTLNTTLYHAIHPARFLIRTLRKQ